MDSSIHFANVNKHLGIQTLYVDNGPHFSSRLSAEECLESWLLLKPASLRRRAKPTSAVPSNGAGTMQEEPNFKGLPPPGLPVASGNHDPKLVLFIDGAKTAARSAALLKRMDEAAVGGGAKLRVDCVEGLVSLRLDRATLRAAGEPTARGTQRPVVGIDAVEQYLGSPCRFASQLRTLIDVDVSVVCTIDSRCCDWLLLAFYLCLLGLTVMRETVVADDIIRRRQLRKSPTKGMMRAEWTAETDAPSLAEFAAQPHQFSRADPKEDSERLVASSISLRNSPSTRAAKLASAMRERESYAHAYQNTFAVGRLLREQRLH
ncbi:hypothetical protein [Paraburkholderia tropica]|uniref:hypothetical protein n=1 Tax=Paraburkholderia tropica TaxID=92647 RepID=UPI001591D410|nr:hypothetical protein [Paraburkholderia tropica]